MNGKLTLTMPRDLEIRDYKDANEAHLIRLIQELQGHEADYYDRMIPPDDIAGWYVDGIKKDCRDYAGHIRFAWLADIPVGYCAIMTRVPNEEADEQRFDYAYISEIVIAKSARGQGIGKALLEDAEALARAANARWLRISVLARNTVARDLYDRFGFEEHVITMEKPLK
ncbi:MAG: GNAT family N-acetyltransferase [Anderseniella sp.]